jgi:GDP-L-fucose synthase
MNNILICGATGFIGRNLVEHFAKIPNFNVRAVFYNTRPPMGLTGLENVSWVWADLRNPDSVKRVIQNQDIVLQFAATTSGAKDILTQPFIHVTDNAVMNSLLLRECYEQSVKHFIFPSCTVMYQPSDKALKETDFDGGKELSKTYFGVGNTKVYIEKMCEFYSRLGRTKHTVIRHSNVYGPYDKYDLDHSHMFGATITKVLRNENGKINVWGNGTEGRDLIYVDDLVEFIEAAIYDYRRLPEMYDLVNVGLGKAIPVREIVEKVIKYSGKKLEIVYDTSQPTIPTTLFLDCERAFDRYDWKPTTDIDAGIQQTIEWYNNYYKEWKK